MNKRSFRGQFAIADLLLALTVVAAWTAFTVSQSRIGRLNDQIQTLQKMTGELSVTDATKYIAIGQTVIRYNDEAWQVHLPEGHEYRLHLATREVQQTGFPEKQQVANISPGLHRIQLSQTREEKDFRFTVAVDDEVKLDVRETADWYESNGSGSTGVGKAQQLSSIDQQLVLKRLRVYIMQSANSSSPAPDTQPVNGLLLWITAQEPSAEQASRITGKQK
jgi:hypothetical protein